MGILRVDSRRAFLTGAKRPIHAFQSFLEDPARSAKVEPDVSLAVFAEEGAIAESDFCLSKEEFIRGRFQFKL